MFELFFSHDKQLTENHAFICKIEQKLLQLHVLCFCWLLGGERANTAWLGIRKDNVSEWGDMAIRGLLFP